MVAGFAVWAMEEVVLEEGASVAAEPAEVAVVAAAEEEAGEIRARESAASRGGPSSCASPGWRFVVAAVAAR